MPRRSASLSRRIPKSAVLEAFPGAGRLTDCEMSGLKAYLRCADDVRLPMDQTRFEGLVADLAEKRAVGMAWATLMEALYGFASAMRTLDPHTDYVWMERRVRALGKTGQAPTEASDGPKRGAVPCARRRRLPPESWPEDLRAAWSRMREQRDAPMTARERKALREAGAMKQASTRAWSAATFRGVEVVFGLYLAAMRERDRPLRVTPEGVDAFVADLTARGRSARTVATQVVFLLLAMTALRPGDDWVWLRRHATLHQQIAAVTPPKRNKAAKIVPLDRVIDLGQSLMDEAERMPRGNRAARLYQIGLMILFLALVPVRLSKLAEMRIGTNLYETSGGLMLHWGRTKNGDPMSTPLPDALEAPLRRWLTVWRPVVETAESGDALWLSAATATIGQPLSINSFGDMLTRITRKRLGVPLNPHIFRDLCARTLIEADVRNVAVAAAALGHRRTASLRAYIQSADCKSAARAFADVVARFQTGPQTGPKSGPRIRLRGPACPRTAIAMSIRPDRTPPRP